MYTPPECFETVEFHGSFAILLSGIPDEAEDGALESIGEAIQEDFRFWRLDDCELEPRSAASKVGSEDVFEELVKIIDLLEEMGWQLYGRILRWGEDLDDVELYILSSEDGVIGRKRGVFEIID